MKTKPRAVTSISTNIDGRRVDFRHVHLAVEVDREGRIVRTRSGTADQFGRRATDGVGDYASDLFVADDALSARALLHRAARDGSTPSVVMRIRGLDDDELVARVTARADLGGTISMRARECDAAERGEFNAAAGRRARFDPLTGLPNRLLLLERARAALETGPQTLVLVDVDRFRHFVTALGSRVADCILVEVGDRLVAALGASGIVGLSGGQFAVLVPAAATSTAITLVVAKVRAAIGARLVANNDTIVLTSCLGVATASADAEVLFANAEVALAQAKSLGPGHDAIFDPAFRHRAMRQIEIQGDLTRAIFDDQFRLEYQPIVDLETEAIVGYEALVRWDHPERGRLAPGDFLGIAQRSDAGAAIDNWVLVEACHQAASWASAGQPTSICVNVAPERFAAEGFIERVDHSLATSGLDPALLVVEITEWSILGDVDAARETLAALNCLGVRVALDDYGTGYSSLADVAALAVDELKIDLSFVAGLGTDRARTAIVHAIVGLGHALGMTVVAEGIENAVQASALRALGCGYGQGFHFGFPGAGPELLAVTS